ncbi:MAG: hypothetical protein H7336_02570 [Bacteriovorax sp.]|nr:hypothetical protein [Bacteriovorax sp.]
MNHSLVNIYYLLDDSLSKDLKAENLFFLNKSNNQDSVEHNTSELLQNELLNSLDSICLYYDDLLNCLNNFLLDNNKFLIVGGKRSWILSKMFNRDIESTFSKVRLVAYLDFLKRIKKNTNFVVTTDCPIFEKMLIDNNIPVTSLLAKSKKWKIFLVRFLSDFLISLKFKKKKALENLLFFSLSSNWDMAKGDRHFGNLKGLKHKFSYIHFISTRAHLKKYTQNEVILNAYLNISDFIKVFSTSLYFYFKINYSKSQAFEYGELNLCSWVKSCLLEFALEDYPAGSFYSVSMRNYFNDSHSSDTTLLTYGELFTINQYLYSVLSEIENKPKIVAIQHAVNYRRKIVNHETFLNSAELPDYYLVHGKMFKKDLENNGLMLHSEIIGCLKYDGIIFDDSQKIKSNKVLIVPSLNDFDSIFESLKSLNESCTSKYDFYLSPHPAANLTMLENKIKQLNFKLEILKNISSLEFAKKSDVIIFSYSSVGLEALFYNKKIIRVFSRKLPKLFDDDLRIPTVFDSESLMQAFEQEENIPSLSIIEDYFGYSDGQVYKRLSHFLDDEMTIRACDNAPRARW